MNLKNRILRSLATGGTLWPEAAAFSPLPELADDDGRGPKVLLVVAHPDDESECAAVLYRITHELGGTIDQVVVTNGEAGFQHAIPAQEYYQLPLTREDVGRKHLPKIRRREVLRASRILGIRNTYFFNQKDTGFTFDSQIGFWNWNIQEVRAKLASLIASEEYDLVLTLLPVPETHGHHQTVATLLLETIAEFSPKQRPAVLGVRTAAAENDLQFRFDGVLGAPLTRVTTSEPAWRFDRRTPMEGHPMLDHSIVVNWVIAEHKSQGMFQMEMARRHFECFWLFEISGAGGRSCWDKLLRLLEGPLREQERSMPAGELQGLVYAHVGIQPVSK
jgi:LmbE family N-acetylglucosaminyl deacetylase